MTKLVLDANKSRVCVRTFAEGLLARLAHDLELVCRGVSGTATTAADGSGSATLEVAIDAIDVGGILKKGRADARSLSASEREDCLDKMRRDVFRVRAGDASVVRVEARLDARKRAHVRVVPPRGPAAETPVSVLVDETDAPRVSGSFPLSISAIGGGTVRGPMNAFRVKDKVELIFDLVFKADQPA